MDEGTASHGDSKPRGQALCKEKLDGYVEFNPLKGC